jgi:hypothetical protein
MKSIKQLPEMKRTTSPANFISTMFISREKIEPPPSDELR